MLFTGAAPWVAGRAGIGSPEIGRREDADGLRRQRADPAGGGGAFTKRALLYRCQYYSPAFAGVPGFDHVLAGKVFQ